MNLSLVYKNLIVLRYIGVAALAYFIDIGFYVVFLSFGINPLWANLGGKVISIILSFFAHRYFTYTIKKSDDLVSHTFRFLGVAFLNTQVSTLLLFIAIKFIPSLIVAKFICDVILFVMGYWVTSKFVFFKKDNSVGNHSS